MLPAEPEPEPELAGDFCKLGSLGMRAARLGAAHELVSADVVGAI